MRPAVPAAATFLACHQLWSSLLMICRMSPVLKGMPAWAQGIRSSSIGSYSNWARTKMSQGGGADRYEGTIWNEELLLPARYFKTRKVFVVNISVSHITALTLKVTLPLASLSSFCRLSIDWLATLIPLISLISSPTWRVAWKYLCQYFAHTQKVNLSASLNRKHNVLKIQERAQMRKTSR